MQAFLMRYYRVIFLLLLISVVGLSFYVGTLQAREQDTSVTLNCSDEVLQSLRIPPGGPNKAPPAVLGVSTDDEVADTPVVAPQGAYAGSKNGTKYSTPGCAGLPRIKPENIVWFSSREDAELQGYSAASC